MPGRVCPVRRQIWQEKQFSLQKLDSVITSLLLRLPPAQHVSRWMLCIFGKLAFFWNVQWLVLARLMDIPSGL
jgi:hypothetical protein